MNHRGPVAGHVLIAGPALWDPNFRRTVVLVGKHDEDGAVGVVLNRPLDHEVAEGVPALQDLVPEHTAIFEGGPVEPQAALVLAEFVDPSRAEVVAFGSIGFMPPEVGPEILDGILRARVFAGYTGWGPGQLDRELEQDSWLVEPAMPSDVFTDDPQHLWEAVVRRLGPGYDMLRTMPSDPSTN